MTSAAVLDRGGVDRKIRRLSTASARVIEPDTDVPGAIGAGQILPDELLSVHGLGLDLTADQRAKLSREEVASITDMGIRFEAVLEAGFALWVARAPDLVDPRVTYILHEMGEETRHQRIFIRLLEQCAPTARNPLASTLPRMFTNALIRQIIRLPALLTVLVLGGEEIPDLFQKKASEHPDTDPFVKAVNKYHRLEEARHLAFARTILGETWETASFLDRVAVRNIAPRVIWGMFDTIVHPGVYESIGLPKWKTWRAVKASPARVEVRYESTRPIVKACLDAGVFTPGRIPKVWRRLAGVDVGGVAIN